MEQKSDPNRNRGASRRYTIDRRDSARRSGHAERRFAEPSSAWIGSVFGAHLIGQKLADTVRTAPVSAKACNPYGFATSLQLSSANGLWA